MNKYKEIEKMLYDYKMLKISITNLEKDIEFLEDEDGVSGIEYEETKVSPTNAFSSIVENVMLSKTEKEEYLTRLIERNKRKLESIDNAVEGLTDIQRTVIKQKYFEGQQWWQVAGEIGYSESTVKRHRKEAIKSLIIGVYGKDD